MAFSSVASVLEEIVLFSPAAGATAAAITWLRCRRGRPWRRALLGSSADVFTVFALLPICSLTLFNPGSAGGVVLIPFSDMFATGLGVTTLYQSGGNVALFVPFGAALPLAFGRRAASFGRVAAVGAALSLMVEALQCFLPTGHIASVDDLLLNTLGTLVGAALTRPLWRRTAATGDSRVSVPVGG